MGAQAEALEEGCLWPGSSVSFVHTAQGHLPRSSTAYHGAGPYPSVINQGNNPMTHLKVSLMEPIPQVRFLLPR